MGIHMMFFSLQKSMSFFQTNHRPKLNNLLHLPDRGASPKFARIEQKLRITKASLHADITGPFQSDMQPPNGTQKSAFEGPR